MMQNIIIFLLSLTVFSCGPTQRGTKSDVCDQFEVDIKKVWNAEVKLQVKAAAKTMFGGEAGVQKSEEIATKMDLVTQDWVLLSKKACINHVQLEITTKEEYRKKTECLDKYLMLQRTLLLAIQNNQQAEVDSILEKLSGGLQCD
ncbi:MAG: hypothetical protein JXX29_06935 [Deltaproteobacteria bacterium]|nr:hypothetical protein [Deltaproteobacteria bacterium]MBN2671388.1 hypothetical protein [Deltaproteobacteria bacterium]